MYAHQQWKVGGTLPDGALCPRIHLEGGETAPGTTVFVVYSYAGGGQQCLRRAELKRITYPKAKPRHVTPQMFFFCFFQTYLTQP